jgi:hypothetical protein
MMVGYMRVSSDGDRQVLDLQRDALLAAGVDERHMFEDHASGSRGERAGLAKALAFINFTILSDTRITTEIFIAPSGEEMVAIETSVGRSDDAYLMQRVGPE